ncbi:hypothetical protein CALVIDRAFT_538920 [Calocera viscosa TUFC12733]|uniref:Uncharacterized protein n=1 Tax=Calocera viscosa (strain TUFC12733) TaxID=1330018 RepID=A0A167KBA4_CALVF|nr:hypothetical protein CALVIDRAFT_538920 [Calocera viscosa TUFC12733]
MPLPARFTSLYRITLRATTASVRHNVAATRNIRALYKPEFEEAAKVVKELESQAGPDEAKEKWYAEWEERSMSLSHFRSGRF